MKEFDWRKTYAPNGYYVIKQRLFFESFERAYSPRDALRTIIEHMERAMEKKCLYLFDFAKREVRVTVWPKEVGEDVNHLDPLRPRLGLEFEMRQPVI